MKCGGKGLVCIAVAIIVPLFGLAQDGGWADSFDDLKGELDKLYTQLLPKCSALIDVSRGIAGFAAIWYIGVRVWRHIANAEPVDLFPLFRPFVLAFAILIFPQVVSLINGILKPVETTTAKLVENSNQSIKILLAQKEEALKATDIYQMYLGDDGLGNYDKWYKYTHPEDPNRDNENWLDNIGNGVRFEFAKMGYSFRSKIKEVISEILQLLFAAASLCINTLRTFNLLILAILGPLVFGFSVFDGFHQTLGNWLSRYINIFLWLPICNIFSFVIGTIQENMLKIDLGQIEQQGDTFFSKTDAAYMIFLIIGIIGYTTIPRIANYVMYASGGDAMAGRIARVGGSVISTSTSIASQGAGFGARVAQSGLTSAFRGATNLGQANKHFGAGYNNSETNPNSAWANAGKAYGRFSNYLGKKLKGNS